MPATITLMQNGLSAGVPGMPNHQTKRGQPGGWSSSAARRNLRFLYSIDGDALALDGAVGFAFTLTVLDCPETPKIWANSINRFLLAMRRTFGCIRVHWVIEWQRRQVPHLHGCLYFPSPDHVTASDIVTAWCELANQRGSSCAQSVKRISGLVGWLQYVAKHAARGTRHYQRSQAGLPPAWQGVTGRMWGHRGVWPLGEKQTVCLEGREGDGGYFAFRRLIRSWRLADARKSGNRYRIVAARRMLKCPERARSATRGVSEWIGAKLAERFLANLRDRGYSVRVPSLTPFLSSDESRFSVPAMNDLGTGAGGGSRIGASIAPTA